MRQTLLVFTIILLILSTSGCTETLLPPKVTVTTIPTPVPVAKYGIGDIVIKNPGDVLGEVITDYNPVSHTYSSRTIIFDKYGTVFYYEGGRRNMAIGQFETIYPHKRTHIDNPYDLRDFDKEYDEKYSVNEIVTKKDNAIEGIKIISYDYPRDTYSYIYVAKRGGSWVNESDIIYTGARTDVETRYEKIKTS